MDSSISFQKLHGKKTGTKPQRQHHRHLRKIANLLRYVELCVVVLLVSRLSVQLPAAVKNSTECFRNFMGSPRFVFLLGNVIIITLFAQSGHFSNHASSTATATATNSEPDLYHHFLQNTTAIHVPAPEGNSDSGKEKVLVKAEKGKRIENAEMAKGYRRCQSEIVARVHSDEPRRVLQRSETERLARSETSYPEDGMSNDDFRRKVEAFIARQQRLRTQEH